MLWSVNNYVVSAYVVSAYVVRDVVSAYVCHGCGPCVCGQCICLSWMWSVRMWSVHMFVRDVVRDAASAYVISAYDVVKAYLCGQGCGQCVIINLVTCPWFGQMSSTSTQMMPSQKASATSLSPSCKIFNRRPGAPNPKVSRLDLPFTRRAVSFWFAK